MAVRCHCGGEIQYCISPEIEKEDSSGKGSHRYSDTITPFAYQFDGGVEEEPWSSGTKVNCKVMAKEVV